MEALNATTTSSSRDDTVPLIPLFTLVPLVIVLMAGVVRLRQAVSIGNAKVEDAVSLPPEEVAEGVRQFEMAVSRSVASSSDANIVCGYILYNVVTFGTDIGSLSQTSDPQQLNVVMAFLTVNVAACGLALLSVMWGLFIKVRDARPQTVDFESSSPTRCSRCGAPSATVASFASTSFATQRSSLGLRAFTLPHH